MITFKSSLYACGVG